MKINVIHARDGRKVLGRERERGIQGFTVRKVAEDKLERLREEGYDGYIEEGRFPYTIFITKQPAK